ncbi:hypothetical protein Poly30_36720 [Planctomycetes bacterium Poly30]|uniref:Uncharacterized protein n=1 Tax=Saltatorellus ferox TaxID=2528018 RepID=A0A518EVL8_9BACT|nr:hypothetical protein Poly30_36720 [Planctomycetes bacterium Poly30]
MGTHRSLLPAAHAVTLVVTLAVAGCASPIRVEESDWRPRVHDLSRPAPAEVVDASAPVTLPTTLQGPLLVKSFLRYELTRGARDPAGDGDVWEIRFQGPERPVQSVDSWASVTLTSPGNRQAAMVKGARVYSGRINVARRGKETDDALLLLPLAFTDDSLFRACEVLGPMDLEEFQRASDVETIGDAYIGGFLAGFGASFTVQRSSALRSLMSDVMQWPSGWLGKDDDALVALRPDALSAEPCSTPFGPGWRVPVEITAGETQAFVGEVTVVEPGGALKLAAGVVEVTGYAPHRPDEVLRLKLVGAHAPRTEHLAPKAIESLLEIKPRSKTTMGGRE